MKTDQPENEAWRWQRADELSANQPEPWYARQAREGRVRDGVAPMRPPPPPVATAVPPLSAASPSDGQVHVRAASRPSQPSDRPPSPAATGALAKGSAVVAGLLFAVAAGWQLRDLIEPAPIAAPPVVVQAMLSLPTPVSLPPTAAPAPAVAPAIRDVATCDARAVRTRLRRLIADGVRREGGTADWAARVAADATVTIAPPMVTTVGDDGARFCGTSLTLVPPGADRTRIVAPVTYTVGAPDGPRDGVTGLQGVVAMARRLTDLDRTAAARKRSTPSSTPSSATTTLATTRASTAKMARGAPPAPSALRRRTDDADRAPAAADTLSPVAVSAAAPARGCADVAARAEARVCADPALSRLDAAVNSAIDRIAAGDDAKLADKVADGQPRFLARRDRCTSDDCLRDRYESRLDDIAKAEARAAKERQRIAMLPLCRGFEIYRPVRPCRIPR